MHWTKSKSFMPETGGKDSLFASIKEKLLKNWFVIGIAVAIFFAKLNPSVGAKGGPLKPEITIKYIAVSVIFFNSGLSLKTEELKKALMKVQLHAFIQIFTLLFTPCFMWFLLKFLADAGINPYLLQGLQVVSCMPPPVSSAVIYTKTVGGNDAAAIFNSAFGSFLGIIVSPMMVFMFVGSSAAVPFIDIFTSLCMTVVVPVIFGQIARVFVRGWLDRTKPPFGTLGSFILLAIIFTTFCDTFSNTSLDIDRYSLISVAVLVVCVQAVLISMVFFSLRQAAWLDLRPADVVCAVFCATHKSLTLGIPMIKIIYLGSEYLSYLSIPLLIYHPTQMLIGGLLVPTIKTWMIKQEKLLTTSSLPLAK